MKRLEIVLLLVVAAVSWATGAWWVLWTAIGVQAVLTAFGPLQRYYRTSPPRRKRWLILAHQAVLLAVLAFYLWIAREDLQTGGVGTTAIWLLIMALPLALFGMGIAAWRRIDDPSGTDQ